MSIRHSTVYRKKGLENTEFRALQPIGRSTKQVTLLCSAGWPLVVSYLWTEQYHGEKPWYKAKLCLTVQDEPDDSRTPVYKNIVSLAGRRLEVKKLSYLYIFV